MASAAAGTTPDSNWSMTRVIAASAAGTAFDWYDFFIFGALAQTISKVFSPGSIRPRGWSRRLDAI